jgi:hypothetical protein
VRSNGIKIDPKLVSVNPIPVLTMPTCSGLTAPRLVEKLKIQSQKNVKQLAEAKEIVYGEGFYSGVMLASVRSCSSLIVPACFNDAQRQAIKDAGTITAMNVLSNYQ